MRIKLLYHTDLDVLKGVLFQKNIPFDPEAVLDHSLHV